MTIYKLYKYKQHFSAILPLVVVVMLWEILVRTLHVDRWILPAPSVVLLSLWESRELLLQHSRVTYMESLIGLIIAIVIAWTLAVAMYFSSFLKRSLYPLFITSQTIPFIALAPLLVVWFGFGFFPKIVVVALVCFFPIVVSLNEGFSALDKSIIRNMQILGANRLQIFRFAVFPSSLPFFSLVCASREAMPF